MIDKLGLRTSAQQEEERLMQLFQNRAGLKKAHADLQDEFHLLRDRLKQQEGATIRVPLPELNEERRRELTKVAHTYAEAARVAIRHIRRDGMDLLKKLEKDGHMSQDDGRAKADQVQKATDGAIGDIDNIVAAKEQEIMQV